jgi:radical SAM superfamily enzyme YgiQ (UPF0313 family)
MTRLGRAGAARGVYHCRPMRILLVTPPMTQVNTPYPATAYLTGFLRARATHLPLSVTQADPSLELFLRLFSRSGLERVLALLQERPVAAGAGGRKRRRRDELPPAVAHFLAEGSRYLATVDPVVRFLQGRDPGLAPRILRRELLPEGPRFAAIPPGVDGEAEGGLEWAFGALGTQDQAKYLASLYVDDLADVLREGVDPRFELSRYGERLAESAASFDDLHRALTDENPTLVDRTLDDITRELVAQHRPDLVGVTAPFPGNVYGAFRMARVVKQVAPSTRLVLGGGYVNTELRNLEDPRVFDFFDFMTLDDGERPFLSLIEHLLEPANPERTLFRTLVREQGRLVMKSDARQHDIPFRDSGTPTYVGLPLDRYVSMFEMLNPMHRLWSDGRWNKLTVAHGCYWKKCTFCDVSLDYIGRYDPASAEVLVDRIESLIAETGQTGFHFVDEAAPPAGLRALAERLIERGTVISWWGNIRFEKTFTPELCRLLASSGCVAISGGLEVASDRLLDLMKKGVTVEQVARVTRAFTDAGVLVHAYLMYGFPTETEQETVDSLERVRQLFEAGCLQSAYWHRFAATAHSPIGLAPARYGIRVLPPEGTGQLFARNEVAFVDPTGTDHDFLGRGLRKAVYNYMHGMGLQEDVRRWFDQRPGRRVPRPQVAADLVEQALQASMLEAPARRRSRRSADR